MGLAWTLSESSNSPGRVTAEEKDFRLVGDLLPKINLEGGGERKEGGEVRERERGEERGREGERNGGMERESHSHCNCLSGSVL